MDTIKTSEGGIELSVPNPKKYKIDKSMPVFYNPVQAVNRDICLLVLKAFFGNKRFDTLDLLSASGARGLRIAKEFPNSFVYLNDANPAAFRLIKRNAELNRIKNTKILNLRAHELLATRYKLTKSGKFQYIDVDPFGTPVPFLDASVKALDEKESLIGITATDTPVLCGARKDACIRRYGSVPLHNHLMHEVGIRILLKKIIEFGCQYDLALTPIFCHSTNHYMRVYLKAKHSADECDNLLKLIGAVDYIYGPVWLGDLWDERFVGDVYELSRNANISREAKNILWTILQESEVHTFGFYDVHELCSKYKIRILPGLDKIIQRLREKGFQASRTHFSDKGIKTNADEKSIIKILKGK